MATTRGQTRRASGPDVQRVKRWGSKRSSKKRGAADSRPDVAGVNPSKPKRLRRSRRIAAQSSDAQRKGTTQQAGNGAASASSGGGGGRGSVPAPADPALVEEKFLEEWSADELQTALATRPKLAILAIELAGTTGQEAAWLSKEDCMDHASGHAKNAIKERSLGTALYNFFKSHKRPNQVNVTTEQSRANGKLKWHAPNAGGESAAKLAFCLQQARDAVADGELPEIMDMRVSMKGFFWSSKIARLRWYNELFTTIRQLWFPDAGGEGAHAVHALPYQSAPLVYVFGMPGIGKTDFRNFMAAGILHYVQNCQRRTSAGGTNVNIKECLIVFDRLDSTVVLVRQVLEGEQWVVSVATTNDEAQAKAAVDAVPQRQGVRVHLLDCGNGRVAGTVKLNSGRHYTMVTSSPAKAALKCARENAKSELREGVQARSFWAPVSTAEEMMALGQLHQVDAGRVKSIVAKYGCVPRRVSDCNTEDKEHEFVTDVQTAVKEWIGTSTKLPDPDSIDETVSDKILTRETLFDTVDAEEKFKAAEPKRDWVSPYVRHLVAACVCKNALNNLKSLVNQADMSRDVVGRLAEAIMLGALQFDNATLFRHTRKLVPTGESWHKTDKDDTIKAVMNNIKNGCTVRWMQTGDETRAFNTAVNACRETGEAGKPQLIQPYSDTYPGIDAVLIRYVGGDGIKVKRGIKVVGLQATVAATHRLKDGGMGVLNRWRELCAGADGVEFVGLVFLLPQQVFVTWGCKQSGDASLHEFACYMSNPQEKLSPNASGGFADLKLVGGWKPGRVRGVGAALLPTLQQVVYPHFTRSAGWNDLSDQEKLEKFMD